MGILITCWNILFPSLKKQLLNRNVAICSRVTFVNVTEDFLTSAVHLGTHLPSYKTPFIGFEIKIN